MWLVSTVQSNLGGTKNRNISGSPGPRFHTPVIRETIMILIITKNSILIITDNNSLYKKMGQIWYTST